MGFRLFSVLVPGAALIALAGAGDAPRTPTDLAVLVIDAAGKEQKLKSWKFAAGIRHLSWLAPVPAAPPPDEDGKAPRSRARLAPTGPEALEFREEDSTLLVEGVLTFVPLDRIRSVDYDADEKTVTARVAAGPKPDDDAVLTGTTRFERVNKVVIEAEVDKGDLGVAEVRYFGGTPRGIRGLRFTSPKPREAPAGRPALVTTAGKMPASHRVSDLQGLYRLANGYERLSPVLMFRKTIRVDVSKIQKINSAGPEEELGNWQVRLKDGTEEGWSLLRVIPLDGQDAQLEGFLGRVPAGYKLFPVPTIAEVVFDEADAKPDEKPPAKPEPGPEN
jgi:hypothetical protein